MGHWEHVFAGDIVTVEYEAMVTDPDAALAPVYQAWNLDPAAGGSKRQAAPVRTPIDSWR